MIKNQIELAPIMEPPVKLETVCRICEESETSLHDLSLKENAEPTRRFCSLTSIPIDATVPWYCCAVCLGQLNDAYDFVQRCIEAEDKRKGLESVVEVKQEEPLEIWDEPVEELNADSSVAEEDQDNFEDSCSGKEAKSKESKVYTCEACQATFENRKGKFAHINKIHGRERFPCKQCSKAFPAKCKLKAHMNSHKTEPAVSCSECSAGFNNDSNLLRHMKAVHQGLKPFACEDCGRKFAQKFQLQVHVRVHMEKVDVSCKQCDQIFNSTFKLQRHISLVHSGNLQLEQFEFKCEVCSKMFYTKSSAYQHKLVHLEPQKLCNICGNKFRTKAQLEAHLATHDTARPFRCNQCPAEYKSKKALHYHQLVHTGLKPYQCELCDRTFRTKRYVQDHTISVHTKEKPHECQICNRRFMKTYKLRLHMKMHQKNGNIQQEQQRSASGELN